MVAGGWAGPAAPSTWPTPISVACRSAIRRGPRDVDLGTPRAWGASGRGASGWPPRSLGYAFGRKDFAGSSIGELLRETHFKRHAWSPGPGHAWSRV